MLAKGFSDPFLTGNIYCAGQQDALIHQVLYPFFQELEQCDPDHRFYMWFVRYPKCGEHLKIRLHGPETQVGILRRLLAERTDSYFSSLMEAEVTEPQRAGMEIPPIDAEDCADSNYPDRSLLWTAYRRSHVSLGGRPFLDDDHYAALLTACLGRGCEIVMAALRPRTDGQFSHSLRQTTLLKLLISGLSALGFPAEKRDSYLAYHRDWLIRFTLARNRTDPEKSYDLLTHFDQRAEQMRSRGLLDQTVKAAWEIGSPQPSSESPDYAWRQALAKLLDYLVLFRDQPDYRLDPFASDLVFAPVFKVFHGLANQLGLGMLNEALAHHLLLRATASERSESLPSVTTDSNPAVGV